MLKEAGGFQTPHCNMCFKKAEEHWDRKQVSFVLSHPLNDSCLQLTVSLATQTEHIWDPLLELSLVLGPWVSLGHCERWHWTNGSLKVNHALVGKNLPAVRERPGFNPGSVSSPGEGNSNPLQYFRLENPMDRGAWQATVHGVANVMTEQLKVNCSNMNLISSVYLYSSSLPVSYHFRFFILWDIRNRL